MDCLIMPCLVQFKYFSALGTTLGSAKLTCLPMMVAARRSTVLQTGMLGEKVVALLL
jgi:hypothetical protein